MRLVLEMVLRTCLWALKWGQIDGKGPESQHDKEQGEDKLFDFRPVWAVGIARYSLLRVILGLYKKIMFCQPVKERTVKNHICQIIDAEPQP